MDIEAPVYSTEDVHVVLYDSTVVACDVRLYAAGVHGSVAARVDELGATVAVCKDSFTATGTGECGVHAALDATVSTGVMCDAATSEDG